MATEGDFFNPPCEIKQIIPQPDFSDRYMQGTAWHQKIFNDASSDKAAKKLSRADLQLLITAKEKEAAEAGEAQPTGASCGCSRTLGSTVKSCFRRLLELLTSISSAVQHHHRSLLFLTQAHIVLCHLLVTGWWRPPSKRQQWARESYAPLHWLGARVVAESS